MVIKIKVKPQIKVKKAPLIISGAFLLIKFLYQQ